MSCPEFIRVSLPGAPAVVKVTAPGTPAVTRVVTPGPPGPPGEKATQLSALVDVDIGGRVDNSLLYYSAATQKFKADSTMTKLTLTDGGNF